MICFGTSKKLEISKIAKAHHYHCFAKDELGRLYVGIGNNQILARHIALNKCAYYSSDCRITSCFIRSLDPES